MKYMGLYSGRLTPKSDSVLGDPSGSVGIDEILINE